MLNKDDLLESRYFIEFRNRVLAGAKKNGSEYSYLGVNYQGDELQSLKLYYTFFDLPEQGAKFPIPELQARFEAYRREISEYHIRTPFVPGCGITFCFKLSKDEGVSVGVYFRVLCDASGYLSRLADRFADVPGWSEKAFDKTGVLKYLSYSISEGVRERSYVYCAPCQFLDMFDEEAGVRLSAADCMEISTDWDEDLSNGMKFIAITQADISGARIKDEVQAMEVELRERELIVGDCFVLHGYYIDKQVNSVFYFTREPGSRSVFPWERGKAVAF